MAVLMLRLMVLLRRRRRLVVRRQAGQGSLLRLRLRRRGEVRGVLGDGLAVVGLRHALDASAAEAGVLVRVPPAVDGALYEATLAAQTRVELRERPSDGVALGLVHEPVAAVLVLGAAGARVDAVLRLEVLRQGLDVDVLDVAADGVLHLDAVARVLEGYPLHAVGVLPDDEGRGRGYGPWRCAGVCRGRGGGLRARLELHARADLLLLLLLLGVLLLVVLRMGHLRHGS